jgi:hypothetical protein
VDDGDEGVPVGPYLLQLRWEVPEDRLDEFRDWYEEEHLPDMASVPGILSARRFERDPEYPFAHPSTWAHLTLYEVAGLSSFATKEYVELSTAPSRRTMEIAAGLGMARTVYRQLFPPHGVLTASGISEARRQPAGTAVLHIRMGCEAAVEDDFNRWYNEEHLPLITGVPGILHGRRFLDTEGDGAASAGSSAQPYLAVYELAEPAVAAGAAMMEAGRPTPWRERLGDRVHSHVQVYREVSRLEGTPP